MPTLKTLINKILAFNRARGWTPLPVDIAKSITIESAELLEHFQWDETNSHKQGIVPKDKVKIGEEVADVFWYLIAFCYATGINLEAAIHDKLLKNEKKFPVEMFKGQHNDQFYKEQKRKYRQNR